MRVTLPMGNCANMGTSGWAPSTDSMVRWLVLTVFFIFRDVQGTLAGFRSPPYAQGIGVAGLHLHFLREDKQAGGHALNYRVRSGRIQLAALHGFHVELPRSAVFLKANFEKSGLDDKIKASEGDYSAQSDQPVMKHVIVEIRPSSVPSSMG
jgi:Alpha-acetolactate decarboxylase